MSSTTLMKLSSNLGNKGKLLSELRKTLLRPLVQLAVKSIEQEHIEDGVLERIAEKYNVPQNKVDEWYAAILMIIRVHLRAPNNSIKNAEFKQCLQELKFENECIDDLCAVLYGHKRPAMLNSLSETTRMFPRVKKFLWRIDITISSSSLSRILKPVILMEWILSTGERKIFELSLAKFHLLRHTLASLLLKMQEMENTNMMKSVQTS
ncbi:COMM domain-containing protein 5 [Venturia canescens]|uniref:COMM domain-containing protein 5 n=1 Tax=Venturia canescens TaxID=32260 RepID=UPI001C9D4550|nr:COMM domain-containing protein 5-like [Venturia canescens]XP_043268079.1 COMM domain-containing protein 5-like [Venturia canescens]